ncbi:ParB N-terminal domain-containing protein [Actinomadura sp. K4S16]|uniref:ParB N-terminal domain-containing protein n=1 Tax=Actinomadura sp. K4S16 TaxID=1316147 RepID=UPI0011ED263C|nr:ParB N-terminal domain-containing protein [Actinomadura sp. K4S16]
MTDVSSQPVSNVEWVEREKLTANSWNPNRQAPPESRLLRVSILENGWTQPIVTRQEPGGLEIVDGYHRWVSSEHRDLQAFTDGLVPVVVLPPTDPALARLATIRHNRARGTHHVLGMADIVAELLQLGLTPKDLGTRLEMDSEEVERLADRGDMLKRAGRDGYNNGWTV